jgi:hypothetical protein
VSVRDGDTANVGDIQLNIGSCDSPGVDCDEVGVSGTVRHRSSRGFVLLRPLYGVDLDTGKVFCPQKPDRVDLSLSESNAGKLYVNPAKRALMRPDCNRASDDNNPLRVDELGPGDDFCVRTKKGRTAHVFVTDEVSPDDFKVSLWFVTR